MKFIFERTINIRYFLNWLESEKAVTPFISSFVDRYNYTGVDLFTSLQNTEPENAIIRNVSRFEWNSEDDCGFFHNLDASWREHCVSNNIKFWGKDVSITSKI